MNKLYIALFVLLIAVSACSKEEPQPQNRVAPPAPVDEQLVKVNQWTYDVMDEVYLWADQLPGQPDFNQDPLVFFEALTYSGDRFSVMVPDYDALIDRLNGIRLESGYEFQLGQPDEDSNDLVAVILYVKKNSPASLAGLQRGDLITHVNGSRLTLNNYQNLLEQIDQPHQIQYDRFNQETSNFETQPLLSLNAVVLQENPNFIHKVLEGGKGAKIGYFAYHFFSPGTDKTGNYDEETRQIFAQFKSQGIDELVIDLRYNGGGAVSSAVNLSSLIGPGVTAADVFSEDRYNARITRQLENDPSFSSLRYFNQLAENVGKELKSGKVYLLVTGQTASASELVINSLTPYMDVVLIGSTTVGKNVGSIAIEDRENPQNRYGLLPIVFQTYNSLGQSDYAQGFEPDPSNQVEDVQLPLLPLGHPDEPLLAKALALINGIPDMDITTSSEKPAMKSIMSSLDSKPTRGLLYDKLSR